MELDDGLKKGGKEGIAWMGRRLSFKQGQACGRQLSLFSAHCAAQSLQRLFFTRPPGGQMWPGSWCWDVHRRIVEAEWSRAREWCMGTGQCGEEAQRGRAAFKLPRLLPDKLLITAAARIRE